MAFPAHRVRGEGRGLSISGSVGKADVFCLVVVGGAEADSICKVSSVAGGVAGRKILVCPLLLPVVVLPVVE